MADDRALGDPELIHHPGEIRHQVAHRVGFDRLGAVSLAVTSLIGGDRAKSGGGKRPQLMAPGIPHLRKSMTKDHRISLAGFMHMHPDTVGVHKRVFEFVHLTTPGMSQA
jgi:hypothetical protein